MINRLAKAQKSWVAKLILTLTALSFMSLFGISGYLSSAGKNRRVIKVDNIELSQAEFQYMLQKEQAKVRNLLGDEYLDDENVQNEMIQKLAARELSKAILDRTAQKYNISVSDELVRYGIMSQPEFQINGTYEPRLLKAYLQKAGISEGEYVNKIRRDVEKQILLSAAIDGFYPPKIMADLYKKLSAQKRVFSYVAVDTNKVNVNRKISEDEVEQYYADFAPDFVEQEKRDADFILIANEDIARNISVSDEEIAAYYQDNITDYEKPETRHVLQMIFYDEQDANKAFFEIKSGKDFVAVAEEAASQSADETDFGYISKDMLIEDLQEAVFSLPSGGMTNPVETENGWQILKVVEIVPMSKMDANKAKADIIKKIKEEKLYDEMYDFIADLEEKIANGQSLKDVAAEMGLKVENVKALSEDGSYNSQSLSKYLENIVQTSEFIDSVFSYNEDEISPAVETEYGFVISRVTRIEDARAKGIDEVRSQIEKMWAENEKSAIAQEIVNDVMHDLESGDSMKDVAQRFDLKAVETKPLARGEASGELGIEDVINLFHEDLYTPKLLNKGNIQVVVMAEKSLTEQPKLSADEMTMMERRANYAYVSDVANNLLNDFARNYDVRVKYRLMGLHD